MTMSDDSTELTEQNRPDEPLGYDPVEVDQESLTVRREMDRKDRGLALPTTVGTESNRTISFRFVQRLPEALSSQTVGFKPEEEPADWWLDDQDIVIEETVSADDPCEFVIGVLLDWEEEPNRGWQFDRPDVEVIDTESVVPAAASAEANPGLTDGGQGSIEVLPDNVSPPGEPSEATAADADDQIEESTNAEPRPSQERDHAGSDTPPAGDSDDPHAGTRQSIEEAIGSDSRASAAEGSPAVDTDQPLSETGAPDGDIVEALIDQLRTGSLDAEQQSVLREAIAGEPSQSTRIQLRHLQSRLEDVVAYADAMEEFLDDNGSAEEVLEEFRRDVDALETTVDELSTDLEVAAAERERLESDIAELTEEVSALRSEIDGFTKMRRMLTEALDEDDRADG